MALRGDAPEAQRAAATSALRLDALAAWRAGLAAVDSKLATSQALARRRDLTPAHRSTLVVAVGKAAAAMMRGALPVARGFVLAPADVDTSDLPAGITVLRGGHPVPTREGIAATRRILTAVGALDAGDTLLLLLSGGASALMEAPARGVDEDDLIAAHGLLIGSGAPIADINRVRACLSAVKGGKLARHAAPARIVTLAISDVPGDDPAVIGSGPTVVQTIDADWAWRRVQALRLELPPRLADWLADRATSPPAAEDVDTANDFEIVARSQQAADAAESFLTSCGYSVWRLDLAGDSAVAASEIAFAIDDFRQSSLPAAIVATGETVVRLGSGQVGRGGRNLEMAARLATALAAPTALDAGATPSKQRAHAAAAEAAASKHRSAFACASAGTDGRDGSSQAAGALIDEGTAARAAAAGHPLDHALYRYDTEPALTAAGDILITGPTDTNVGDLLVAVVGPGAPGSGSC